MQWIVSIIVAGLLTASANDATPIASLQTQTQTSQNERIDQTFQFNANGRISLKNINGDVAIETWDRNEARVEAVKTIDCDKPLDLNVQIDQNPNYLQIETKYPKNQNTIVQRGSKDSNGYSYGYDVRCRELRVEYKLTVPRAARLDKIETVNGGIALSGLTDFVDVGTVNGKISARALGGSVNLSSVNGTLDVDFADLNNVRDLKMGIVNGTINLKLPSDVDAIVQASTVNGAINNDFGLPVQKGQYVGRNLRGKLGDGKINVQLNGVNGTINVRRKQDGRSLKSVQNLLLLQNNESNDDNDEDSEVDDDDDSAQISRTPRAPRTPRTPRTPKTPQVAPVPPIDEMINGALSSVTREQIRRSLKEASKAMKNSKLINDKEIRRQVRQSLKQARQEIEQATDLFDFNGEFNSSSGALWNPLSQRDTKAIQVSGTPNVIVNAPGGAVTIRGWNKAEVSYSLARNTNDFKVDFSKNNSDVNLTVNGDSRFRLEIYVPRESNLKLTTDGQIRIENVKGNLQLDGADETVDVRDANGKLAVRAANAKVRVVGFAGETSIKTQTGDIALEGDFASVDTDTQTGNVFLTLNDAAALQIQTSAQDATSNGVTILNNAANAVGYSFSFNGVKNQPDHRYSFKTGGGKIIVQNSSSVRVG